MHVKLGLVINRVKFNYMLTSKCDNIGAHLHRKRSARIILEGSFGLQAKTQLLGSTFRLVYMPKNCQPFECLVEKCKYPAMLFLTTRLQQGHLWFQDGGWANWASWGCLHGGRIILAPESSFLSDRNILAVPRSTGAKNNSSHVNWKLNTYRAGMIVVLGWS